MGLPSRMLENPESSLSVWDGPGINNYRVSSLVGESQKNRDGFAETVRGRVGW